MTALACDMIDYSLTPNDYKEISEAIRKDLEDLKSNIESNVPFANNATVYNQAGTLEVDYKVFVDMSKSNTITEKNLISMDVTFWGMDRDGEDYEEDVPVIWNNIIPFTVNI